MWNCSQFLNSKIDAAICDEIQYDVSEVLSGFNVDVVNTGVKVRTENQCCVALDCFKCLKVEFWGSAA